jgi:hypothetical protein
MADLTSLIGARGDRVAALLSAAVRVDVALYLSRHLEGRIVHRPHWMRRTPRIMFEEMRTQTDARVDALIPPVLAAIAKIRSELGLGGGVADDEFAPVVSAIAPLLEDAARDLLLAFFVPGDSVPDRADDSSADLSPSFDLTYQPTLGLRWAFSQVRMMDVARAQAKAAGGKPAAPSFELRMFLPEALADDPPA